MGAKGGGRRVRFNSNEPRNCFTQLAIICLKILPRIREWLAVWYDTNIIQCASPSAFDCAPIAQLLMVPERPSRRVIKRHRMCMRARTRGSLAYLRAIHVHRMCFYVNANQRSGWTGNGYKNDWNFMIFVDITVSFSTNLLFNEVF